MAKKLHIAGFAGATIYRCRLNEKRIKQVKRERAEAYAGQTFSFIPPRFINRADGEAT
jgi:hypothetical protein